MRSQRIITILLLGFIAVFIATAAVITVIERRRIIAENSCTDRLYKVYRALNGYELHYKTFPFDCANWRESLARFDLLPNKNPKVTLLQSNVRTMFCCTHGGQASDSSPCYTTFFAVTDVINAVKADKRIPIAGEGSSGVALIIELPERAMPIATAEDMSIAELKKMSINGLFPMAPRCHRGLLFSDGTILRQIREVPFDQLENLFKTTNNVGDMRNKLIWQGYFRKAFGP